MYLFHLLPRDKHETHRVSTPLELMFDLASVIAIATAATGLHHAVAEGHFADGILKFSFAFFMIWIAWMNYTWFASAYDNGSRWFQSLSMVIMFGALVMAAGMPAVFNDKPLYLTLTGFIIMRLGLVFLWLAVARGETSHKTTALRYAGGITIMQIYWISITLLLPADSNITKWAFVLGFLGELCVPVFAERHNETSWHRHHIIERYGLLNIIVLGECFLAIVLALGTYSDGLLPPLSFIEIGIFSSIITFAMWMLYFSDEEHLHSEELKHAIIWGYGHLALFAAGAATGAGFAVFVEYTTHHAHISKMATALSVAIPVAIYVFTLWVIRDRYCMRGASSLLLPIAAILLILAGIFGSAYILPLISLILIGTIILRQKLTQSIA